MKKGKNFSILSFILLCVFVIGCGKKANQNSEADLLCNKTSGGQMAETENGYFARRGNILYYADKTDLTTWVAVCNKPDCIHNNDDWNCNAFMPSGITQKGDKIYGIGHDGSNGTYIFEMKTDGSGKKIVYSFSEDDNIEIPSQMSHAFPEQMVWFYRYLDELGIWHSNVLAIRENENGEMVKQILYESTSEEQESGMFANAQGIWNMRGDAAVLCGFLLEEGEVPASLNSTKLLVRIGETSLERIILPEELELQGNYMDEDSYIYYIANEGFYQIDIPTGEKTLLFENAIEDAMGFILNEDYMIECNRYYKNQPENPCFRFYNGKEWKEVELPEKIKNSNRTFAPIGVASDKMFFNHAVEINGEAGTNWYYLTINEETPEFIYIGDVSSLDQEENSSVEETKETTTEEMTNETTENDGFEEIVVFDNEHYFLKITNISIEGNNYVVDFYGENRKKDGLYAFFVEDCAINGLECNPSYSITIDKGKTKSSSLKLEECANAYHISDIYNADEYTKIELGIQFVDMSGNKEKERTLITFYPKGEENVITYTREPLDTDVILVDNEYVSVILTGYGTDFIEKDTLNVYLVNKTDQWIQLDVSEVTLNDKYIIKFPSTIGDLEELEDMFKMENVTQVLETPFYFTLNPKACAIYEMTLFNKPLSSNGDKNEFLTSNQITNIEKIRMELRVSLRDNFDECFSFDEIILNP